MKTRSVFVLGVATGVAIGTLLATLLTSGSAVAQLPPLTQPPRQQQQQGAQILLDERRLETVYANGYRLHTSSEEVVADLGFNMPNPSTSNAASADLLFDVRMRLVMSFATAKRFQDSLESIITRYEELYGPIRTDPPQARAATQPGAR